MFWSAWEERNWLTSVMNPAPSITHLHGEGFRGPGAEPLLQAILMHLRAPLQRGVILSDEFLGEGGE